MAEIFGSAKQLTEFVQRAVGYCLTGDTSEQVLFMCFGTGANGKSTLLDILRFVFGPYAYNLPFSAFELKARSSIPNEIAALNGKRFVTAIETNELVELNEGRIKALTGSDPITARFLYREFFTFEPTGKFWLAFNHKPRVSDDSPGFWRRVMLIPFMQQFGDSKRDPELLDKLKAEAPGILNWAIQGTLKWQAQGLGAPEVVIRATLDCVSATVLGPFGDTSAAASHRGSLWDVIGSPIPSISDPHGPPDLAVRDIIIASVDG